MAMPPLDLTLIQALLTSKTISNEITNANDLTSPGFYFAENPNLGNLPSPDPSHVFVNANTEKNRIVQICVPENDPTLWVRTKRAEGWSDWQTFVR